MGTTADKLNRLIGTKQAIREAIVSKGVSVSDQDTFNSYASKIRAIPQEGGGATTQPSAGAVTFRDYDGTVLHAYSKDEFLALTAMPALPTQPKLTCQGWNYTLEDAQAYVEEYGVLEVGATYITDDGKTRLYITIAAAGRMDVPICFLQTDTNGVVVNWGDGSEAQTYSGTTVDATHHYDSIGDYVITLEVVSGQLKIVGESSKCIMGYISSSSSQVYPNMLKKVEIGNGVTSIGNYVFDSCYSLSAVVIPNSVTSIGNYAFRGCNSLSAVVIPNSVTSIGNYAFRGCNSLSAVVIPNSVTNIESNAFYSCNPLSAVVIPNSVTSIGYYAFGACNSLSAVVIPNSVTSIESSTFSTCYSLSAVVIPNSVTSIGNGAFYSCKSLSAVVIPNSVTNIESNAFGACYGVAFYDFSTHESVPTLAGTFSGIASDCKIIVPDALYDEWIAASKWSTYADRIIKASEYNG